MAKVSFIYNGREYDSDAHYNLILTRYTIEPPEPNTNIIEIPGSTKFVDLSESVAGFPTFKPRKISLEFTLKPSRISQWLAMRNKVLNTIHGRYCKIIFSDDVGFYYIGRVAVKSHTSDNVLKLLTIECTCQPFKYVSTETTQIIVFTNYVTPNFGNYEFDINMPTNLNITAENGAVYYKLNGSESVKTLSQGESVDLFVSDVAEPYKIQLCGSSSTARAIVKYQNGSL